MRSCPLTVSEGDGEARGEWPGSSRSQPPTPSCSGRIGAGLGGGGGTGGGVLLGLGSAEV